MMGHWNLNVFAAVFAALLAGQAWSAEELKYPRTEIELDVGRETLTNNGLNWNLTQLELSRQVADRYTIYGNLREINRFGLKDTDGTAGFYYPLTATWTSVLEAGVSPSHHISPRYSLFGQLHNTLGNGWGVEAGVRHSEYERSAVDIFSATAERYWGNWRGAYTFYAGRPQGAASGAAHRLQLTYYYNERNSIGVCYTTGREVENIGPPNGVRATDVKDLTINGRYWFSNAWGLSYEFVSHEQGTLYRRQGLRLGVRHSF